MKSFITKSMTLLFIASFLFTACSKENIIKKPQPIPPGTPGEVGSLLFVTDTNLNGAPYHPTNLQAVVTAINEKGEEVLKEKMLILDLRGTAKTETIKLPVGNYKLTRFRMVYGAVNTHFATPMTGSQKAGLVEKPLAIDFKVTSNAPAEVAVEVVPVKAGERPEKFGYPSGAFDNGQSDADPYMKVKIKAIMQIGDVLYDSIPASLMLTTWDEKGEATSAFSSLKAGINEVPVLKAAVKYRFYVSKWGTKDEMTLNKTDIDEETVYTFGGSKSAKKLKSELTYKLVNGQYIAETKNVYNYDADGKLSAIQYYMRKKDNTPYLAMTDRFDYNGNKVSSITKYDEETKTKIGETSFTYDQQGKIRAIAQKDNGNETNATVEYFYNPKQEAKIHYKYPGKTLTMDYVMTFGGGNMVQGSAATSNGNIESGNYNYDLNINPYIHMNWPNLFLSNSSKNNIVGQSKFYYGAYPTAEPYSFNYTYDADGYPKELIKQFKSYFNNVHMFTTKTVYTY